MFFADELNLNNENEVNEIKEFLQSYRIIYERQDKTYVIRKDGEIIATGSRKGNVLKYFFVDCTYSGQGAIAVIFNQLLEDLFDKGYKSYFVFTTPNNKTVFQSLGLNEISSTDKVTLLEGGFYNMENWLEEMKEEIGPRKGTRGAIVANCNPMTLGHKYLVTEALEHVDQLLVFVVEEDLSIFPFEDRYEIVKNELKDFNNVKVLKGGSYIISRGTFPTYFIKKKDDLLEIYTDLDATIFGHRIAKGLEINIRFLGTEDIDDVTNAYNKSLIKMLDDYNVDTILIPRLKIGDKTVSASYVRRLIKEEEMEKAYKLLTIATKRFLETTKGEKIIQKIKDEDALK